jgi:hypothetical protein
MRSAYSTSSSSIDDKTDALPGSNWLTNVRKPKSVPAQRSTRSVSRKGGKKAPKHPPSKRCFSTGLHNQDSDISRDRQKKKAPLPLDKINTDKRNVFTVTGTGPKTILPYVPNPMHVTKLMQETTKKAISRSISPTSRTVPLAVAPPIDGKQASSKQQQMQPMTATVTLAPTDKNTTTKTMIKTNDKLPTATNATPSKYPKNKNKNNTQLKPPPQLGFTATTAEKPANHPTRRFPIESTPKAQIQIGETMANPPGTPGYSP